MNNRIVRFVMLGYVLMCSSSLSASNVMQTNAYDKDADSFYQIYAVNKDKETIVAVGGAIAISKHYLATNCHVALGGNFLVVNVDNNPYLSRICYNNQEDDLCIIDVAGVSLKPAKIRASKTVKKGEQVYVISNPKAKGKIMTTGKVTDVLHENGRVYLQTDAAVSHGSSGGGLFDNDGSLIGIITSGVPGKPIGFAVPTELILEVLDPAGRAACTADNNTDSGKPY